MPVVKALLWDRPLLPKEERRDVRDTSQSCATMMLAAGLLPAFVPIGRTLGPKLVDLRNLLLSS